MHVQECVRACEPVCIGICRRSTIYRNICGQYVHVQRVNEQAMTNFTVAELQQQQFEVILFRWFCLNFQHLVQMETNTNIPIYQVLEYTYFMYVRLYRK